MTAPEGTAPTLAALLAELDVLATFVSTTLEGSAERRTRAHGALYAIRDALARGVGLSRPPLTTEAVARALCDTLRDLDHDAAGPPCTPCLERAELLAPLLAGLSRPPEPREALLRDALFNVSVHSAHLPEAPRDLLVQLLARCGEIARKALRAGQVSGEER